MKRKLILTAMIMTLLFASACSTQGQSPSPTRETSIGPWPPETRARATAQALADFQTVIPPEEVKNYELMLFMTALPMTSQHITLAPELQGVYLLMDKAGHILGLASYAVDVSLLTPALVMSNAVKYTIELPPPGYTQEQMMQMSADGWKNLIFRDVIATQETITDAQGRVLAQINVPKDYLYNSDTGGQTVNPSPPPDTDSNALPQDLQLADQYMKNPDVLREILDTMKLSRETRFSLSDQRKPDFNHVREFNMAVYDPVSGKVYEGQWNDFHDYISAQNGVTSHRPWPGASPQYNTLNGVSFKLKQVSTRIFKIDIAKGTQLSTNDIANIENSGYRIINERWNWIFSAPNSQEGYREVQSSLIP